MTFGVALSGAPEEKPEYPTGHMDNKDDSFGQDGDDVFIRCDASAIPSGLCRLDVEESDGTVTRYYPKLNQVGSRWLFRASIWDILGGRRPCSPQVKTAVVTATPVTASQFDNGEVRRFVNALPADSPQRKQANNLLGIGEAPDE